MGRFKWGIGAGRYDRMFVIKDNKEGEIIGAAVSLMHARLIVSSLNIADSMRFMVDVLRDDSGQAFSAPREDDEE